MTNNDKVDKKPFIGTVAGTVFLILISLAAILTYKPIYERTNDFYEKNQVQTMEESADGNYDINFFLERLIRGNYTLYYNITNYFEEIEGYIESDIDSYSESDMEPEEIFHDDNSEAMEPTEVMEPTDFMELSVSNQKNSVATDISSEISSEKTEEPTIGNQENHDSDMNSNDEVELRRDGYNLISNWWDEFFGWSVPEHQLKYYILDNTTGEYLTNASPEYFNLNDRSTIEDKFPFFVEFQYKENGEIEVSSLIGLHEKQKSRLKFIKENFNREVSQYKLKSPSDITIIYATEAKYFLRSVSFYQSEFMEIFAYSGFLYVFLGAYLLTFLLAVFLPFIKLWGVGKGITSRIPFEVSFTGICISLICFPLFMEMAIQTASGYFLKDTSILVAFPGNPGIFIYGINFLFWFGALSMWYISLLSIRQIFTLGLKRYIKEKTIVGIVFTWFIRKCKRFFRSLFNINFRDSTNKAIIKILAVNFLILMVLCSIWIFGIFVLLIYTVILFFILRKYLNDIKKKYMVLLNTTHKMAEGKLEVSIEEDLGVFNSIKEELMLVKDGFQKAVEEEVKSQNMKTELITNVSHDLKTPLTSIITYIDLLKDETLSPEDKKSYIETIDQKAHRLKRLIEDLFEVSKASTNNVTLNLIRMDLVSLIKQVALELNDKIVESEIDFRNNMPEEKVYVNLDSEKTYRIFENLILNITKYAMPHTRAYINMELSDELVTVIIKNISREELDFNTDDISERFVRGDKSRNTEGSGLGLAIVKSFVELQGGTFQISIDGDLYKVVIEWKRSEQTEQSEEWEPMETDEVEFSSHTE